MQIKNKLRATSSIRGHSWPLNQHGGIVEEPAIYDI